ncbi:MAG TPA: hypothetical protein VKM72_31485 [Thermoanaerobaculia bacterium]|nr:hypothetical protein [Thermoanaerobaculia bacterium]
MRSFSSLLLLSLLPLGTLHCNAAAEAPERSAPQREEREEKIAAASPARIRLEVRETSGVARQGEVLRSGVPLPRSLNVRDPRQLAVIDAAGQPVSAQFDVLARWNAGLTETEAPVQWVLVIFPATVPARGSAAYWLVTGGSGAPNPPPPRPLKLTQDGNRVTVDTGAAVFQIGPPGDLFGEIRLASGKRLVAGGGLAVTTGGRTAGHPEIRRVWIEHSGPLSAAVVVDGAYDVPAIGGGGLGSRRRYLFAAGSPTVLVRHAVAWEGNLGCKGCIRTEDGKPNGVRIDRVRDTLVLDPEAFGELDVAAVGAFGEPAVSGRSGRGGAGGGEIARVRQIQRARREDRLAFEVAVPSRQSRGEQADGAMLSVGGPGGAVAVALDHMHRYEPQALRLLGGGRLAVDLADDHVWLAHHQGLFATLAVAALPGEPARKELDRVVWAPLNQPLHAWPDAAWFAGSGAVAEIPVGPLPRGLDAYDQVMSGVLHLTQERIDQDGLAGLMTFGVLPRYWGRWDGGEIRCKERKGKDGKMAKADPTPQEPWDDTFWCGTWTDYHNTLATAPVWAMRSGEVEWLNELAIPGALRTLHTQIMQCGPGDAWFYCGQSPAGYAGYREDFNSSHAYFDNLYLYFWLTGDRTVPDTLRRGAENMRRLVCSSRGPQPVAEAKGPDGPACGSEPLAKSSPSGRVGYQWLAAFRFVGLAGPDASFLEDYRSGIARMLTHQYAELEKDGKTYGFLGGDLRAAPQNQAGPLWVNAFYDSELLYRWIVDSGDAPLGDPPLRASRVLPAVAHTLVAFVEPLSGKTGGPKYLIYKLDGPRLGGRLLEVRPEGRELFFPEKAGMAALLARAGRATGDPELLKVSRNLVATIFDASRAEKVPLGKLQGQYLSRLSAAVAELAAPPHP